MGFPTTEAHGLCVLTCLLALFTTYVPAHTSGVCATCTVCVLCVLCVLCVQCWSSFVHVWCILLCVCVCECVCVCVHKCIFIYILYIYSMCVYFAVFQLYHPQTTSPTLSWSMPSMVTSADFYRGARRRRRGWLQ